MEKDLSKMTLGELVSELLNTHDNLKGTFDIKDGDSRAEEMSTRRQELMNYEKQIYEQLDEKEKQYNSYKPSPIFAR